MTKALAVLNIGGGSLHRKSRSSFVAACERWGCDFVEFKKPIAKGVHHYWQKTFAIDELSSYDQVIQLDADMLVHKDAEDPSTLVPADSLGVVSARQHYWPNLIEFRNACMKRWAARTGLKVTRDARHLNAGLIIYSPKVHSALFSEWREFGRRSGFKSDYLPEQCVLSMMLARNKWKDVVWLPHRFNKTNIGRDTQAESHLMSACVYHFSGSNSQMKSRLIEKTEWRSSRLVQKTEARTAAILKRLPETKRPYRGAEVGVLAARNASTLLRERPRLSLRLVDLWKQQDPTGTYSQSKDGQTVLLDQDWAVVFQEAASNLMPFHGRYNILQDSSVVASRCVDDASLDFVFIDADHSKAGCLADIDAWLPKIKADGWIGGHDYSNKWGGKWGVRDAVLERFDKSRVETDIGDTWFVRV